MQPAQYYEQRFESLKTARVPCESEWRDLNDFILPYRGRFSTSESNKPKRNRKIYDGTAGYAARTLSSGLMAGITSPARPWFRLATPDPDMMKFGSFKIWLEQCEDAMMHVLAQSNFYNILPNVYSELGVFGTGDLLEYEDREDVVRFFSDTIGEYFYWVDDRGAVCGRADEKEYSIGQCVKRFGIDKLSPQARALAERGRLDERIIVRHVIELNDEFQEGMLGMRGKKYRSVRWEKGATQGEFLEKTGFNSKPFMAPRWNVTGLDTYGRGAGSDVLGDVISLQAMTKKKAKAVDKQIDPAVNLPAAMKNSGYGYSLDPGAQNFVEMGQGVNASPAQTVQPNLSHFVADIQEVQQRIKHGMYEDLFLMLVQMDRAQITATEIIERKAEKLIALGPVVERMNDELLEPIIDRTFEIMQGAALGGGRSLLPPPPPDLVGVPLKVEFVSIFRQAQQQEDVTRTIGYVQNLALIAQATGDASAMDNLDIDQAAKILGDKGGVPARVMASEEIVAQKRKARADQVNAQIQQQNAMQMVEAAKALGNTPISQDQNALGRMMGMSGV